MDILTSLDNLFAEDRNSFTSKSPLLDKEGHFYHVTQQGYNYNSIFSLDIAKYRTHMMFNLCEKNHVIPLCNVIMPNHTHDLFYCQSFADIAKVMRLLNSLVSKSVKREKSLNNRKHYDPVFMTLPSYERISEKRHLFFLFKYFYDNPKYLKEEGKFVPFTCFDMWEKEYYKPYKEQAFRILFDKSIKQITDMCSSMTKEQFMTASQQLFGNEKL